MANFKHRKIARIQQLTDETVRLAAIEIGNLGGQRALDGFLTVTLCNLLGVAIVEQGQERARELMARGYITADDYTEPRAC